MNLIEKQYMKERRQRNLSSFANCNYEVWDQSLNMLSVAAVVYIVSPTFLGDEVQ